MGAFTTAETYRSRAFNVALTGVAGCVIAAVSRVAVALLLVVMMAGGCSGHPTASPTASAWPPAGAHIEPGGCGGTAVITGVEPPPWALGGFSGAAPTTLPWALSRSRKAVAYLFATELVAGHARANGTTNKVLWVVNGTGIPHVSAHPSGLKASPVLEIGGQGAGLNQLPSFVDLPTPGCWTFDLTWGNGAADSLDLQVLPEGSLPVRPTT